MNRHNFSTAVLRTSAGVAVYGELWSTATANAVAAALREAAMVVPVQGRRTRACGQVTVLVTSRVIVRMIGGAEIYGGSEWAEAFAEALGV